MCLNYELDIRCVYDERQCCSSVSADVCACMVVHIVVLIVVSELPDRCRLMINNGRFA